MKTKNPLEIPSEQERFETRLDVREIVQRESSNGKPFAAILLEIIAAGGGTTDFAKEIGVGPQMARIHIKRMRQVFSVLRDV